jgi:hypothetical protein
VIAGVGELAYESRRDAVDPHRNQVVGVETGVSEVAKLADVVGRGAVNAHRDELIGGEVLHAERLHRLREFAGDAVNAECHQFIGIDVPEPSCAVRRERHNAENQVVKRQLLVSSERFRAQSGDTP